MTNIAPTIQNLQPGLGSLADTFRHRILRQSRITLGLVGLLTVAYSLYQLRLLNAEIATLSVYQAMAIASEIPTPRLLMVAPIAVGVVFLGLAAFVYRYPLACTLSGLVIYLC